MTAHTHGGVDTHGVLLVRCCSCCRAAPAAVLLVPCCSCRACALLPCWRAGVLAWTGAHGGGDAHHAAARRRGLPAPHARVRHKSPPILRVLVAPRGSIRFRPLTCTYRGPTWGCIVRVDELSKPRKTPTWKNIAALFGGQAHGAGEDDVPAVVGHRHRLPPPPRLPVRLTSCKGLPKRGHCPISLKGEVIHCW